MAMIQRTKETEELMKNRTKKRKCIIKLTTFGFDSLYSFQLNTGTIFLLYFTSLKKTATTNTENRFGDRTSSTT